MTMGLHRAEAPSQDGNEQDGIEFVDLDERAIEEIAVADAWPLPESAEGRTGRGWLAGLLVATGLAWIGASAWSLVESGAATDAAGLVAYAALVASPLILLAMLWLIFGQTPRRETVRFTRAVTAMREESAALESVLAAVSARLEDNYTRLTDEAAKLMTLGEEASDRLGRVTHYLSKESAALDRKAAALEAAASAARVDIGVLLEDLPRAEGQARSLAGAMQEAGLTAHERAGALEAQLSALIARGREADEVASGAAQRLAAQLARIETSSSGAAARMDEAGERMTAAVDGAMGRAAEALGAARSGIDEQASAVRAMIEEGRAAFERAGDETGRSLAARLAEIGSDLDQLTTILAAQDVASRTLTTNLSRDVSALDQQFATLGQTGRANADLLSNALAHLHGSVENLQSAFMGGQESAGALIARVEGVAESLTALETELNDNIPQSLTRIEERIGRAHEATAAILPDAEAARASAEGAATHLTEAEAGVARQSEALQAMLGIVDDGVRAAEARLQALAEAVGEADEAAARIVAETSPELVDALVRVRDTANQAAEKAREAISAVIPQSAATLAEASRLAVGEAISGQVVEQMGELSLVAERAVEAARRASERLTRQMLTLTEAAAAVEARIEEGRREHEERDSESFSRRVALLIESLNSTAIDVTKIFSNEVTDSAWAAYLKGDRGVFTRRAVRLLDTTEAREIVQHYETEPEFRDQVNRYIHDFEAMLRRVLADREGSALGVTLLSSDMGKLYVALAQAIERLRS